MRHFHFFRLLILTSCDSSIKEFNVGFSEGYKEGLKSNGCKEFKDKRKSGKISLLKMALLKDMSPVIDCIKS